ncbi:MAG: hypothetical protein ACKOK7_01445 [Solirubrobacterales bacterium]
MVGEADRDGPLVPGRGAHELLLEAGNQPSGAELDEQIEELRNRMASLEMSLPISGESEEELVAESAAEARKTLQREAVLAAVVEAEGIEPSDGDILDALQGPALQEKMSPQKLRKQLEKAGRLDDLKDDLAQRAALDFLVENAVATA